MLQHLTLKVNQNAQLAIRGPLRCPLLSAPLMPKRRAAAAPELDARTDESRKRAERRRAAAVNRGELVAKPRSRVPPDRHGKERTWDYTHGGWIDSDGMHHLVERNAALRAQCKARG